MNSAINGDYMLAQLRFQQKRAHFQELGFKAAHSPGGSGVVVHSLGRRSGPTLPHHEAEVSGVGSP